jgi:hypothetical protein
MTTQTIFGIGALIVIVVFVVVAFREGFSVKPSDDPPGPSGYT